MNQALKVPPREHTACDAPPALLLWLSQPSAQNPALVGAKTARLAQLMANGMAVPEGFCLTVEAYQQALYPAPVAVRAEQRALISNTPSASQPIVLPGLANLQPQLFAAFRQLRLRQPGCRVAVRSSAPEEDGATASWAGIFESVLHIDNEQALLNAVTHCYHSLHSATASAYRDQQRLQGTLETESSRSSRSNSRNTEPSVVPSMAVLIQVQVDAHVSGVLFTRNPLTNDPAQLCVNAVQGVGESLQNGAASGTRFVIPRHAPTGISQQRTQTPRGSAGALSSAQLAQLRQQALRVESLMGPDQDIEFAFDHQRLWLLQARPIPDLVSRPQTRQQYLHAEQQALQQKLQRLQQRGVLGCGAGVLSNSNIGELLPSPTPMSFGLFKQIFIGQGGAIPRGRRYLGYRIDAARNGAMFTLVAGQPYFHLELDALTYHYQQPQPIAAYLQRVRDNPQLANYPEFGLYEQFSSDVSATKPGPLSAQQPPLNGDNSDRQRQDFARQASAYLQHYRQSVAAQLATRCHQSHAPGTTPAALIDQIEALIQHLQQYSCYHFVIVARLGFYFAASLRRQLSHLCPKGLPATRGPEGQDLPALTSEQLLSQLLQALPGSRISEQGHDEVAMQRGELTLECFLQRYGHLAENELEIALPRFHEHPEQLQALLARDDTQHDAGFRTQIKRRKATERRLRQQLERHCPADEAALLLRDMRLAQRLLPLRETIKYHFAAEYAQLRQLLLALAPQIGLDKEQIFYLQPGELRRGLAPDNSLLALIAERQTARQLAKEVAAHHPLPAMIDGESPQLLRSPMQRGPGQSWQGEVIATGLTRGRVRLVKQGNDSNLQQLLEQLQDSDILVTGSANLGLSPLLRRVAGLVVEIGGFLAHSACQAREAGIPALVLPQATRLLRDGETVLLDGSSGMIYCETSEQQETQR